MNKCIPLTYDLKKEIFDVKDKEGKYSFPVTFSATRENAVSNNFKNIESILIFSFMLIYYSLSA